MTKLTNTTGEQSKFIKAFLVAMIRWAAIAALTVVLQVSVLGSVAAGGFGVREMLMQIAVGMMATICAYIVYVDVSDMRSEKSEETELLAH